MRRNLLLSATLITLLSVACGDKDDTAATDDTAGADDSGADGTPVSCVTTHEVEDNVGYLNVDVCTDGHATCADDDTTLAADCAASGYTEPVADCAELASAAPGGWLQPGTCPNIGE
jgi:hypothetical protein